MSKGVTTIFIDESGYCLTPFVARTWALTGMIPFLEHPYSSWKKLSVISGLAVNYANGKLQTRMFFRIHPRKTIATGGVVEFLHQIRYQLEGEIIVVWDNLKTHKSTQVERFFTRFQRFNKEYIPPYCPELNPDEGVWNWTKRKDLINVCPKDTEDLVHKVRSSLKKFQRRKHLHRWCLNESELPWEPLGS